MIDYILVHSPLVGPITMEPTARVLEHMGHRAHVPFAFSPGDKLPAWRDWPKALLASLPEMNTPVVVGHSMGGLLAAWLTAELGGRAMVCLDADMPPAIGPTPPVTPDFRTFLDTLPVTDGALPQWQYWWGSDALASASIPQDFKRRLTDQIPAIPIAWFDDVFDMPDWSRARKVFIQTSDWFDAEAENARAAGWDVSVVKGTHLHPTFAPQETATALVEATQPL